MPFGNRINKLAVVFLLLSSLITSARALGLPIETKTIQEDENPSVTRFREYLRINSAHPTPDYESCINWLKGQAEEIGLDFHLERYTEDNMFALWLTWNGSNSDLKSILIDTHMDVVAVDPSKWEHSPFGAEKDEEGNIYARGSLDMKSATVGILEAFRKLKSSGFMPLRTIHLAVLPDEELFSRGVKAFVNSTTFSNLNIGFALDEAIVSGTADMLIVYAEKSVWQFNFTARGVAAHSSTLPAETAGQKIQVIIDRLMEYRATQLELLNQPNATMENVTSLNLVRMGGGLGNNIIPDELWVSFDMRIVTKPGWSLVDVENLLDNITKEAGSDVSLTYLVKAMDSAQTPTDDTNVWWVEIQRTCGQLNISCTPTIPNGVTDGRYIRNTGIPLFGLNPFPNTIPMAHQDDERINENNFLHGIERYVIFIQNLSTLPADKHP